MITDEDLDSDDVIQSYCNIQVYMLLDPIKLVEATYLIVMMLERLVAKLNSNLPSFNCIRT